MDKSEKVEMKKEVNYNCNNCGAINVKLWRPYQGASPLLCCNCVLKDQDKDYIIQENGRHYEAEYGFSDQVGWFVPAIPCDDIPAFWGYTSVPDDKIAWWSSLPLREAIDE